MTLPIRRLAAALSTVVLAGVAAAQPMQGPPRGGPMGHMHVMRHLRLSEAQQDQIFNIHHERAPALRELHKALHRARAALAEAAKAPDFDRGRARELADTLGKAQADLALMRAETLSRVRAVLTPEQRSMLDKRGSRWRSGERPSS